MCTSNRAKSICSGKGPAPGIAQLAREVLLEPAGLSGSSCSPCRDEQPPGLAHTVPFLSVSFPHLAPSITYLQSGSMIQLGKGTFHKIHDRTNPAFQHTRQAQAGSKHIFARQTAELHLRAHHHDSRFFPGFVSTCHQQNLPVHPKNSYFLSTQLGNCMS